VHARIAANIAKLPDLLKRPLIHGISISGVTAKVAGVKRISLCALQ